MTTARKIVATIGNLEVLTHRERPILAKAVQELYDHVGWRRRGTEEDIAQALGAGPVVGAWDGDRLVGLARALSDGHLSAYVEDVMIHERYRRSGVGDRIMARLLEEVGDVETVILFCEPSLSKFYEKSGFRQTTDIVMQRGEEY
jgi:GNAT superfamily N-acetyltransferase